MMAGCGGNSGNGETLTPEQAEDDAAAGEDAKSSGESSGEGESYKIAVVKQMDHASLDEIAEAVCEELIASPQVPTMQSTSSMRCIPGRGTSRY